MHKKTYTPATTSKISSTKQNTKNNEFHVGKRAHAVKISLLLE